MKDDKAISAQIKRLAMRRYQWLHVCRNTEPREICPAGCERGVVGRERGYGGLEIACSVCGGKGYMNGTESDPLDTDDLY